MPTKDSKAMAQMNRSNKHFQLARRHHIVGAMAMLFTLSACKATPMTVILDVVTFNYLDRPIFDVYIGNEVGDSSMPYPDTGGSTISRVPLSLGPQKVTWRLDGKRGMPRNGETVQAKNVPELRDVPSNAVFLGLHIYPDETVELVPSRHYPQPTAKGEAMAASR